MAKRVRTRRLTRARTSIGLTGATLGAALFVACERAEPEGPRPDQPTDATPQSGSPASTDEAVSQLDTLLDHHQGPLRGRFDRFVLQLVDDAEQRSTILVDWPNRVQWTGVEPVMLRDGELWKWNVADADSAERIVDDALIAQWRRRARILGVIAMQPLSSATDARADGENAVRVRAPDLGDDEAEWRIVWRETTREDGGMLHSLASVTATDDPECQVEFDSFRALRRTNLPTAIRTGDGRSLQIRFLETDTAFLPGSFKLPGEAGSDAGLTRQGQHADPGATNVPLPSTMAVRTLEVPACRWLKVPDPGDWPGRRREFDRAVSRLSSAGQQGGGDVMLLREQQKVWLIVPFVPTDPRAPAFEAAAGESIEEVQELQVAAVDAGTGESFVARIDDATRRLDEWFEGGPAEAATSRLRIVIDLLGSMPDVDPDEALRMPVRVERALER